MSTFQNVQTFTGLNGPGRIASVSLASGSQVLSITNLTTLAPANVHGDPDNTTGFYGFQLQAGGLWQFDTNDLSSTKFLAVVGSNP